LTTLLAASSALHGAHVAGAWVVIVGNALVGLWALGAHRWPQLRHRALWIATAVAEIAVVPQVVMGVILIQGKDKQPYDFHMLYGFSTLVAVGILYSYRQQLQSRIHLLYGCGGLFLMGLGLRAMTVGPR
jgi:hypothetical protein